MTLRRFAPRALLFALPALLVTGALRQPAPAAEADPAPPSPLAIETDFSFTTNLVHWVDNLAGTSAAKTMPFYRRYWEERFGPIDAGDRAALEGFARVRRAPVLVPARDLGNERGCLPVRAEELQWRQIFLAEAMASRSLADLRSALSHHLGDRDVAQVMETLERFRPRFERVWKDLAYVDTFDARFRLFLDQGPLRDYLASLAAFFGVSPGPGHPMKISFIGLPSDGPTHAEADGDRLLIEIRPLDEPIDQVQVVAHEASHFLMRLMPADRIDRLAARAFGEGEAGALFWRYIWEGLPTALGQGVAEARLSPRTFSRSDPWYHIETIDRFAKLIYPAVARAMAASRPLDDRLAGDMTRALRASSMSREARAVEYLMTAFYASGEGLAGDLETLRGRLGLRESAESPAFPLADPGVSDWLRRYACAGGVMLVSPSELPRAVSLDGAAMLPRGTVEMAQQQASRGVGVIAAGRRANGGPVWFLVTPGPGRVGPLVEALARLRGVPDRPVLVTMPAAAGAVAPGP